MIRLLSLYFCACLSATVPAYAAQCTLATAGLRFGILKPQASSEVTSLGTFVLTCRGKTGESVNYHLRLTPGSGSYRQRVMSSGSKKLAYNLYLDASRSQVWGDGSASTSELAGSLRLPGPVYSRLFPVYAQILSPPSTETKPYVDTVLIELSY